MVILGCISYITDFSIKVELPGLTFGYVNITRISDSFTKLLNTKLEENDDEVRIYILHEFLKMINKELVIIHFIF